LVRRIYPTAPYRVTQLSDQEASVNRSRRITAIILCCLVIILALFSSRARSAEKLNVHVDNLPETLQIKGAVSVEGPVSHTHFVKKEAIVVPPSRRAEPSEMAHAGSIESNGFTAVTLSFQGEVKGGSAGAGTVGVLLIPDEEPIVRAFREARRLQFAIECVSTLKSGDPSFFNADQVHQRLTFPRYKVFLYNTTNKTVEANLFMTLTN
jgi:hypothetical protein